MGQLFALRQDDFTPAQGILIVSGSVTSMTVPMTSMIWLEASHHRVRDAVKVLCPPSGTTIRNQPPTRPFRLVWTPFSFAAEGLPRSSGEHIEMRDQAGFSFTGSTSINGKISSDQKRSSVPTIPCPTACVGEPLRFGKVCLSPAPILG